MGNQLLDRTTSAGSDTIFWFVLTPRSANGEVSSQVPSQSGRDQLRNGIRGQDDRLIVESIGCGKSCGLYLIRSVANQLHYLPVRALAEATHEVALPRFAMTGRQQQGIYVVFYMQPVRTFFISVERERFACGGLED